MKSAIILIVMAMLVPPKAQKHNGESEADAKARYAVIAEAMSKRAGDDRELAAFLLATARHESAFVRQVHSGKRKGDQGRSWGLYQLMCGKYPTCKIPITKYRGRDVVGLSPEATARATDAGAIHLLFHMKRCKRNPYCVFRNYIGAPRGKLSKKNRKVVYARVATYQRVMRAKSSLVGACYKLDPGLLHATSHAPTRKARGFPRALAFACLVRSFL